MPKLPNTQGLTANGRKRFGVYLTAFAVLVGIVVATLISFGYLTEGQFESWVVMVGVTVPSLVGIVTNLLSLFNVEKAPDQTQN